MAEWRKVTHTIGETGTPDRTDDVYEFGAKIDGVFVAYGTKSAGYIEHLIANAKARQEQEQGQGTDGDGGSSNGNGA